MQKPGNKLLLVLLTVCITVFVASPAVQAQMPPAGDAVKPVDLKNFDMSAKPEIDFYRYANGSWMDKNPIPADQSRWGSFNLLQEQNFATLHQILEAAAARTDAPKGSIVQKVGDFYASGMDSVRTEQEGAKAIASELAMIGSISKPADLQNVIAEFHRKGMGIPFVLFANQDDKKSTDIIIQLYQGGLGLPDRDYYTKEDEKSKKLRDEYVEHVTNMFMLLGDTRADATAHAATVMSIETELAKASMTRVEQRDPEAIYHKMTVAELGTIAPSFAWDTYFAAIGKKDPGNVNVGQPGFLKTFNAMLTSVPLADWKTYLRWHLVHNSADYLSSAFVNENFHFSGTVLNGIKELKPRWKRVLQEINGSLGEALGQLYVERAFPPQAKTRAKELVENLRTSLAERIKNLSWMSGATKEQALKKLQAFGVKIGYPDKWRDYASLTIDRGSYAGNVMRASEFEFRRGLEKVGKPVDRTEWLMSPPTVNAYYNPTMNEIVFPAGILQPPFFYATGDDAVNYGGIGAVIGHEMTHGFDDQGRKYSAEGNLTDWWTKDDEVQYNQRANLIEQQFNGYVAIDTLHVNGKLTLGENIADLGGLTISFYALQKALEKNGRPGPIDGFTPEQRFFLSWAQVWRQNVRDENLRLRLVTDPHSPGQFRCNGPLSNMPEFVKAFAIPDGAPMVRPVSLRAVIW